MSELDRMRRDIPRAARIVNLPYGVPTSAETSAIPCEDCPAADACKSVNNFRKSCPPGKASVGLNPHDENKCVVGTNLLLYRIATLLEKGHS